MAQFKRIGIFIAALFFLSRTANMNAEEISDPAFGYALDIPEGYALIGSTADGMSYLFAHDRLPVQCALRLYDTRMYPDAVRALGGAIEKLGSKTDVVAFSWCGIPSAIAEFEVRLDGKNYSGRGVAAELPMRNTNLVLLCYSLAEYKRECAQFVISTLNSLSIVPDGLRMPGIITDYAFPEQEADAVKLSVNGKKIMTRIDADAAEAAQFVVDCEYAVLKLYAGNALWQEAWRRYYRLLFRDGYSRLRHAAADIKTAVFPDALKKNPKNPEAALNEILLNHVQQFKYERGNLEDSDFTNIVDCLTGKGSDCDSRSMLMCVLLEHCGIKTIFFVSHEYRHAVYGADIQAPGAKIRVNGAEYLLGETTEKNLKPGLIEQSMSNTDKWIPVPLP